jgi:sialate O-acetylesterase
MHQMNLRLSSILLASGALLLPAKADVTPSKLFTDNMVIQRETQAPVWGWADAGEVVTVIGSWGESASTKADEVGKWMVQLKTPKAGGPYALTIQGNNTVEIKNVLSGEVWFCSGQSNMDRALKSCSEPHPKRTQPEYIPVAHYIKKEMETAKDDLFRQFEVEKNTSPEKPLDTLIDSRDPEGPLTGCWRVSSPENNPDFSATAYFFGRELRKELQVPVGLIKCAWGGSRVEPWIPAAEFQKDKEMTTYWESHHHTLSTWDPEKAQADYEAAVKKSVAEKERNPNKRVRRPKMAKNPHEDRQFCSTLFNAMVHPVIPYAIQGAIWYQGESNTDTNTHKYEHNFSTMISSWRMHWGQGDFSFYFAQLANYKQPVTEPLEDHGWPSVCDQQRRTLRLKNTGMAVLNDIGEARDIHPYNKVDAGKRLALWALKNDYGQEALVCSGPLYKRHTIKDGKMIITFDHVGSGLMAGEKIGLVDATVTEEPLQHFQICDADRQWRWAQAEIIGNDSVVVSHPEVPEPVVVRYAWASNPKAANLYNKEGLPASIFTTETNLSE